MQFNKADLRQIDNLIIALKKGSFTMDGMEILAMSDSMKWLSNLHRTAVQEVQEAESVPAPVEPPSAVHPTVTEGLEDKKAPAPKKRR